MVDFINLDKASSQLRYDPFGINNSLRHINELLYKDGALWFVNWNNGLGIYDGQFRSIAGNDPSGLRHTWTHDLIKGPRNQIWVGQKNGLYAIERDSI